MYSRLKEYVKDFVDVVNKMEVENEASRRSREYLETTINRLVEENKNNKEALDIATHAIEILKAVSDESVGKAYKFLQESLNTALKKMFKNTTRQIEIKEGLRSNQYPQLEIILHVGNNRTRSLKSDSGHGIAQIVSLLSILSLIVITGSRRMLVLDEVLSGVSVKNREIVDDILWSFTEIGFQFLINEHGFISKNSNVYHLEMMGDVSGVKHQYIAKKGVYLQSESDKKYDYEEDISVVEAVIKEEDKVKEDELDNMNNNVISI